MYAYNWWKPCSDRKAPRGKKIVSSKRAERVSYIDRRSRLKRNENNFHNKSIIKCVPIIGGNPDPAGKPPPAKKMQSLKTTERASYIVRRSRLKRTMLRKYQMYDENHIVLINDNINKDKK